MKSVINDLVQEKLNDLQHESDEEKDDIRMLIGAKREHVRSELGAQIGRTAPERR